MNAEKSDITKQLEEVILMLNKQTIILESNAVRVLISTAINLAIAVAVLAIFVTIGNTDIGLLKLILFIVLIIFSIPALYFLFTFDQKKKHGDIVFEEASDYYEWVVSKSELGNKLAEKQIQGSSTILKLRLSFREYTGSCDLPLVPGKQGIRGYTLINIMGIFVVGLALITISI